MANVERKRERERGGGEGEKERVRGNMSRMGKKDTFTRECKEKDTDQRWPEKMRTIGEERAGQNDTP